MKRIAALIIVMTSLAVPVGAQRGRIIDRIREGRGRGQTPSDPAEGRGSARSAVAGTQGVTITYQGMSRRYLLHAPANPSGALILAFHGGSETPENQEEISGFSQMSDREGFIVAYPEGIGKSWADGRGTTVADQKGVDDVGFAKATANRKLGTSSQNIDASDVLWQFFKTHPRE